MVPEQAADWQRDSTSVSAWAIEGGKPPHRIHQPEHDAYHRIADEAPGTPDRAVVAPAKRRDPDRRRDAPQLACRQRAEGSEQARLPRIAFRSRQDEGPAHPVSGQVGGGDGRVESRRGPRHDPSPEAPMTPATARLARGLGTARVQPDDGPGRLDRLSNRRCTANTAGRTPRRSAELIGGIEPRSVNVTCSSRSSAGPARCVWSARRQGQQRPGGGAQRQPGRSQVSATRVRAASRCTAGARRPRGTSVAYGPVPNARSVALLCESAGRHAGTGAFPGVSADTGLAGTVGLQCPSEVAVVGRDALVVAAHADGGCGREVGSQDQRGRAVWRRPRDDRRWQTGRGTSCSWGDLRFPAVVVLMKTPHPVVNRRQAAVVL